MSVKEGVAPVTNLDRQPFFVFKFIISKGERDAISNSEQNMTETDINCSVSFIYDIKQKRYHKQER